MALNPRIGNLDSPNFDTKLLLNDSGSLNLENFSLNHQTGTNIVKSLQKETQKERDALKIESSRSKRAADALEEMKKHLENVKMVKRIVASNRLKKDYEELEFLSKNQKESLQEVFEIYYRLSARRKGFLDQLKKVESFNGLDARILNKTLKTSSIRSSLEKINWLGEDGIRLKNDLKTKLNVNRSNFYGWGSWSQNPFNKFFSTQSEFLKAVDRVNKSEKNLKQKTLSIVVSPGVSGIIAGSVVSELLYREEDDLKRQLKNSKVKIEMKIAEKLLALMNFQDKE